MCFADHKQLRSDKEFKGTQNCRCAYSKFRLILAGRMFVCLILSRLLQDLFFRYSLNNFLHAQVDQCINFVFTWAPAPPLTPSPSPPLATITVTPAAPAADPEADDTSPTGLVITISILSLFSFSFLGNKTAGT